MERGCAIALQGGVAALLIAPPLAFGAVYGWGIALIGVITLLTGSAWMVGQLHEGRLRLARTPLNIPILLFLSFVSLQMLPLAPGLLRVISPHTYAFYQQTLIGWPDREPLAILSELPTVEPSHPEQGIASGTVARWRPLSLHPYATMGAWLQALAYAAIFFLVVNSLHTRTQLDRILLIIVAVGSVVAVHGLVQTASGTTKIYGLWQPQFGDAPFGPYVNRNHFAGYMAMILPLGLGWLWGLQVRALQETQGQSWGARLGRLARGRVGRRWLLVFALVTMVVALLLSASRGGITSFVCALLFLTSLASLRQGEGSRLWLVILSVLTLVLVFGLWQGSGRVLERIVQGDDNRPLFWRGTLSLIAHYPWLGTGLGTYADAFRRHNIILVPTLVEHAHNDYLELLAEVGAVGFVVVVGGVGWFCWRTLKRWIIRHDPEVRGIVLGGLASVVAVGVHSLVDFNLHIPAHAVLLAVILGLTTAAVHQTHRGNRAVITFRVRELVLPRSLVLALYPLVLLMVLMAGLLVGRGVAADRYTRIAHALDQQARGIEELELVVEHLAHAITLDPGSADRLYRLGLVYDRAMRELWVPHPTHALVFGMQAMAAYREAILRNPTLPLPYLSWGWTLESVSRLAAWGGGGSALIAPPLRMGGTDLRVLLTRLAHHPEHAAVWAQQLMQTATYLAPTAAFGHYSAGLYALQRWEVLEALERARAIQDLRSAVRLEPMYASGILQALWDRTRDPALVRALAHGTSEESKWREPAAKPLPHPQVSP